MKIVCFLPVRKDRPYLKNCLSHLISQGVSFFIVDNESEDGSRELLEEEPFAGSLAGVASYPFSGYFDWGGLLSTIDAAAKTVDADWLMLTAPDEIIHSYSGESLKEVISRLDADGCEAINCNEFVFLPIDHDYIPDSLAPQPLRWYYLHEPQAPRHIRAKRADLDVTWAESGGHRPKGEYRIAEESLALRHYLFRSQEHAFTKYPARRFSEEELRRGWHKNRADQPVERFAFPPTGELEYLTDPASTDLSRDNPKPRHYWQW